MTHILYPLRGKAGLTPQVRQMHAQLYAFDRSRIGAISDAAMMQLLSRLRAAAALDAFCLWLVGSRLEPGKIDADIDLVLSPRGAVRVDDPGIEQALWHCRAFGLNECPSSLIDPCFRAAGPALSVMPLRADTMLQTSKLFSPKLARLLHDQKIGEYRRFGHFSIEYVRRAGDTGFFSKLPRLAGSDAVYLRPAVEIL